LWITYARYFRPLGESITGPRQARTPKADVVPAPKNVETAFRDFAIQGKGLLPDIEVDEGELAEFGAPAPRRRSICRPWNRFMYKPSGTALTTP
jgi:hypothetical protein